MKGAAWILFVLLCCAGCGARAEQRVRYALEGTAHGLVAVDHIGQDAVRSREARCDDVSNSFTEWRECMAPVYRLRASILTADHALRMAEAAVDASGAEGFSGVAPCVAKALAELDGALRDAGAELPPSLSTLARLARGYGGSCDGGE